MSWVVWLLGFLGYSYTSMPFVWRVSGFDYRNNTSKVMLSMWITIRKYILLWLIWLIGVWRFLLWVCCVIRPLRLSFMFYLIVFMRGIFWVILTSIFYWSVLMCLISRISVWTFQVFFLTPSFDCGVWAPKTQQLLSSYVQVVCLNIDAKCLWLLIYVESLDRKCVTVHGPSLARVMLLLVFLLLQFGGAKFLYEKIWNTKAC